MDLKKIKEDILKKFPGLKNPKNRRMLGFVCIALAFFLMATILSQSIQKRKAADTVASEGQVQESIPLDTPMGENNDILQAEGIDIVTLKNGAKTDRQRFAEEMFSSGMLKTGDDLPLSEGAQQQTPGDTGETERPLSRNEQLDRDRQAAMAGLGFAVTGVYPETPERERPERKEKTTPSENVGGENDGLSTYERMRLRSEEARRAKLLELGYDPDTGQPLYQDTPASNTSASSFSSPSSSSSDSEWRPQYLDESTDADAGQPQSAESAGSAGTPSQSLRPRAAGKSNGLSSFGTGSGLSSLSRNSAASLPEDRVHPFEVMFSRDEKITPGGRVSLRLLEDMMIGDILIPKNTPLSGICSVGDRLEIRVPALKMGDRIIMLDMRAYDTDGLPGLYCPMPETGRTLRSGVSQAGQIASSALQSGIAGYAGQIVSAGASIIQSRSGSYTISVSAGYKFLILREEN